MNLKVAMLTEKPAPHGGIGGVAYNLSKELAQLGVRVYLICRGEKEGSERISRNFCMYTLPHYTRDSLKKTIALYSKERFNIVHFMSLGETSNGILTMLAMKALRLPVLMHIHSPSVERRVSLKNHVAGRIALELIDRFIPVSEFVKDTMVERSRIPYRKIEVVYNGVNTRVFRPTQVSTEFKKKYGLENFNHILLSVGVLQSRKGQHMIIQSLPFILKHHPNVCYINVGGARKGIQSAYPTGYVPKLENLIKKLRLADHVKFLSGLTTHELVQLYNSADMFIHAATVEAFGLVVVEAMACGKPAVTFNASAMPEIVDHRENGILVETANIKKLASAINELLDDDALRKTLGKRAKEKIEKKFTWSRSARKLLTIYRQCMMNA